MVKRWFSGLKKTLRTPKGLRFLVPIEGHVNRSKILTQIIKAQVANLMNDVKMIKRMLPDGSKYYLPENHGFWAENIDEEIDQIYNPEHPHYYEAYYELKEGMTVVDAGAYTGLFTLKASKAVGPDGMVIALEPFPTSFNILALSVKRNRCKNVVLLNEGLGSSNCWKKLIVGDRFISASIKEKRQNQTFHYIILDLLSTLYRLLVSHSRLIKVKLTTLDELMSRFSLKQIHFLKMDIEGYELEALKGYTKTSRNNILSLETHRNLDEVLYLLRKKGYSLNATHIVPINGRNSIVHTRF